MPAPCKRATVIRHPYTSVDVYQGVAGDEVLKDLPGSVVYGSFKLIRVREIRVVPVELYRDPIMIVAIGTIQGGVRFDPTGREFALLADSLEVYGVAASVLDFVPALGGYRGAEKSCGQRKESKG